ncbi:MAG: ArsA family ATPase [Acidimicrobiales bacterium]
MVAGGGEVVAGGAEGSFEQLLSSKDVVIAVGSGGVGKTTTAAALAATAAAELGGRVLVLTVDPARRLANALGLQEVGNTERRVAPDALPKRSRKGAELWVAMLDTKQSWDDLVRRHAPDPATALRILDNSLYQGISGRFVQSHEYVAMERLYEAHARGYYDLVVVDTPPSRNALDFLEAPRRMAEFFSSRLLRWLIAPYRSRLVNIASRPFYQVADRILGSQFLSEVSEFFMLFQSMYPGFVSRADAVSRLLVEHRTSFVVVTTLEAAPAREAEVFMDELEARGMHVGAVVLNKVMPAYLLSESAGEMAREMSSAAVQLAAALTTELGPIGAEGPETTGRVLAEIAGAFCNFSAVARREAQQRSEMSLRAEVTASVPFLAVEPSDMEQLLALGKLLWGARAR